MSQSTDQEATTESDYKEVTLGPKNLFVPTSWTVEKLGSDKITNKIKAGGTPKAASKEYYGGNIKYVKIEDMTAAGKYIRTTKNHLTEAGLDSSSTWLVPKCSLLLSMYGSYGKATITRDKMATNQAILGIIPSDSIDLDYLYYATSRLKPYFESVVLETTQANLNKGIVENAPILYPPFAEQYRIADILSTVDEQIQQTDEIIETARELKRGLMKDILHKGIEHSEFKEMQIGPKRSTVPAEWEVVTLDEIADVQSGSTPKRGNEEYWKDGTIPWVKSGEFNDRVVSEAEEKITEKALDETGCTIFPQGTLLIALYGKGTVSKTARLGTDAATNQAIAGLLPKNGSFDPRYLQYYLIDSRNTLLNVTVNPSSDTGRTNIYLSALRKFKVPLPPVEEQQAIADRIAAVDAKIADEKETKQHYQELKRGLMQDLLTGKVRVDAD